MRYEEYKDTGLKHIPEIPSSWKVLRNRAFLEEIKTVNCSEEATLLSLSQYTGVSEKTASKIGMHLSESLIGYRVVSVDDIVMNIMLAWNGSTACSEYNGVISPAYAVFRSTNSEILPRYLHYLFRLPNSCAYFKAYSTGIIDSRLRLYPQVFLQLYSIVPPREEQDQIVRFLDWKVSRIDKLIHGYQKQIKLLEERRQTMINQLVTKGTDETVEFQNSGIEYIGNIPIGWRATKLREVFSERNTKVSDKDYPALSVGKMGITPQLDSAVKTDNGDNRKLICKGDFAINSRSDRKGAGGISQYDGSASLIITVLKPHHDLNRKFYHYLLRSHYFVEEFYRNGHGLVSDLWTTKWDEMRNIYIPVPTREEQDEIVEYIVTQEKKYKTAIESTEKQIELLKEYRTRLISDVVTGQMDVRGIEIPEYEIEEDIAECQTGDEEDVEVSMDAD